MSNVILSLIEQKLKDRIASDLERMKMAVNHELQGRAVDFYWNDPHERSAPPQLVKGEISSAGFDAEMNITVVLRFDHPSTGTSITVPRYLSELR